MTEAQGVELLASVDLVVAALDSLLAMVEVATVAAVLACAGVFGSMLHRWVRGL